MPLYPSHYIVLDLTAPYSSTLLSALLGEWMLYIYVLKQYKIIQAMYYMLLLFHRYSSIRNWGGRASTRMASSTNTWSHPTLPSMSIWCWCHGSYSLQNQSMSITIHTDLLFLFIHWKCYRIVGRLVGNKIRTVTKKITEDNEVQHYVGFVIVYSHKSNF